MKYKLTILCSLILLVGSYFIYSKLGKDKYKVQLEKTSAKNRNTQSVKKKIMLQEEKKIQKIKEREIAQTTNEKEDKKYFKEDHRKHGENLLDWDMMKEKLFLKEEKMKIGKRDYFVSKKVLSAKKEDYTPDLGEVVFEHNDLISFVPESESAFSQFFPVLARNHGNRPLHMTGVVIIDYSKDNRASNYDDLELSKMDLGKVKYESVEMKKVWLEIESFEDFEKISQQSPESTKVHLEFFEEKMIRE